MNATMIFWNDSADVALMMNNGKGGSTYVPFENVSEAIGYANENGINICTTATR